MIIYRRWLEMKYGKFGKREFIRHSMLWVLFIPVYHSRVVIELKE